MAGPVFGAGPMVRPDSGGFKSGSFLPPPDPAQATKELLDELHRLRQQIIVQERDSEQAKRTAAQEAEQRRIAEAKAEAAYGELNAALSLVEETSALLTQEQNQFVQQLATLQAQAVTQTTAQNQAVLAKAQKAASLLDLDESATRRIIDQQLRDAGWEADTETLNFKKGTRPQKGKNLAIAEWPTLNGPADYVLFNGLTVLATVEAKKAIKDVPGSIEQAKRYSRDYRPGDSDPPITPWGEYRVPFCFATNGRPFLRQIHTKSGVWFLDARKPTNLARPLESWYTPQGLIELLALNDKAGGLYDLQTDAIAAVKSTEAEIRNSRHWLELTAKEKDIKRPTPEDPDAAFDPRRCPLWRTHYAPIR